MREKKRILEEKAGDSLCDSKNYQEERKDRWRGVNERTNERKIFFPELKTWCHRLNGLLELQAQIDEKRHLKTSCKIAVLSGREKEKESWKVWKCCKIQGKQKGKGQNARILIDSGGRRRGSHNRSDRKGTVQAPETLQRFHFISSLKKKFEKPKGNCHPSTLSEKNS